MRTSSVAEQFRNLILDIAEANPALPPELASRVAEMVSKFSIREGDRVLHPRFGVGTVQEFGYHYQNAEVVFDRDQKVYEEKYKDHPWRSPHVPARTVGIRQLWSIKELIKNEQSR